MKSRLTNLVLVLIAIFVSLIGIEAVLYFVFLKPVVPHDPGLYEQDPTRGYRLAPGFSGMFHTRAGDVPAAINGRGYRGPEWAQKNDMRFVFLGDSFTFGIPLPAEKGIVMQLAKRFEGRAEFINLGVPGYGVPHILETIKKECPQLKPAHVFYLYYLNDTRDDNLDISSVQVIDGYLAPSRTINGTVIPKEEARLRFAAQFNGSWSITKSLKLMHLRQFLSQRGIHPRQLVERFLELDTNRYVSTTASNYSAKNTAEARDLLLQMHEVTKNCQAAFTMVILPGYAEAYYGVIEPATERLLAALNGTFDVLDLRKSAQKGVRLVLSYDAHYGPAGISFVSDRLATFINRRYPTLQ